MLYKNFVPIILEAIDEKYCTFEGVKRFVERKIGGELHRDDLAEILDAMVIDEHISLFDNNAFSAYLRFGTQPVALFVAGAGKVNYLTPGENDNLARTGLSIASVKVHQKQLLVDDNTNFVVTLFFGEKDYERIQDLIAENHSYEDVAKELGVSLKVFTNRSRTDGRTKSAIARGRERSAIREQAKVVRQLAADGKTNSEIETALKGALKLYRSFSDAVKNSDEIRSALESGRNAFHSARTPETVKIAVSHLKTESVQDVSSLSGKRLCACGNPLGARVHECRNCYLLLRSNSELVKMKAIKKAELEKEINKFLSTPNLDQATLIKAALSVILECRVKEKLKQKLYSMAYSERGKEI